MTLSSTLTPFRCASYRLRDASDVPNTGPQPPSRPCTDASHCAPLPTARLEGSFNAGLVLFGVPAHNTAAMAEAADTLLSNPAHNPAAACLVSGTWERPVSVPRRCALSA